MSDFGSEMGSGGLGIMTKVMEALLKLLGKLFELWKERTGADYKLKKEEYKEAKEEAKQRKFVEKIEGKTGFVNHRDLQRAGVPLTAVGITLDDKGFKELADRCKREGIVITGVEDIRDRELNGRKSMILECKQSDLPRLGKLVDLMNDEKKIGKVQEEISKVESSNIDLESELAALKDKEGELSPDELERISKIEAELEENHLVINELDKQIDDIRYQNSQELNQEQAYGVCEKAVNGETLRGVSFNEALDRWTGGSIDKDKTAYVVDAKDPNRVIVCNSKNDTFRDREYTKTTYEVYNGSKQVYATNDGRFEGRPKDYWAKEKVSMREAGGFSDQVIKFYSAKELEAYRQNYREQNAAEIDGLGFGKEGRDYDAIINVLETKMDECGGQYKDGIAVSKETGKPMILTEGMSDADRARVAEAAVIGKQIANYKELSQLENELAIARTDVLTADEGTPEHATATAEFEKAESKYNAAIETERDLIDERKSVNAVQAEQGVKDSPMNDLEYLPQDKEKIAALESKIAFTEKAATSQELALYLSPKLAEMRGDLEQMKSEAIQNAQNAADKPDERRDDRVDEIDDDKRTMAVYKGEIDTKRQADGAKGNDIKDREAGKHKTLPKDKGDR